MKEEIVIINKIIYSNEVKSWCKKPYNQHKKGCPNYNKKSDCPPNNLSISQIFDMSKLALLVGVSFDLKAHAKKMKQKHPNWTDKQCRCLLYWQASLKKKLRAKVEKEITINQELTADYLPEGHGVHITKMMYLNGIDIWKKPLDRVWKIALLGCPLKDRFKLD